MLRTSISFRATIAHWLREAANYNIPLTASTCACNPNLPSASISSHNNESKLGRMSMGCRLTFGVRYTLSYRSDENYIDFEKDYYQILGVDQKADLTQIKQKFYFLAKEYHPDKAKGQQAMFKAINQAYNILSQPKLRQQYDSNRNRDPAEANSAGLASQTSRSKPLNYQPYSQMSRMQWAVLRQGYMTQSKVDYSNFKRTYDPQQDLEIRFKKAEQWNRVFRTLTKEQILEEIQFRAKLEKKYLEDVRKQQEARQQFYEQKFRRIGDGIERALGKTVRSLYDYLIKK